MDKVYLIKSRYDDTIFFTLSDKEKRDKLYEFLGGDYYSEDLNLDDDIDVYNLKRFYYIEIILDNSTFYNRYEKNNLFHDEKKLLKDVSIRFVEDKLTKITIPVSKEKYENFGYKEKIKYDEIIRDVRNLKNEEQVKELIRFI